MHPVTLHNSGLSVQCSVTQSNQYNAIVSMQYAIHQFVVLLQLYLHPQLMGTHPQLTALHPQLTAPRLQLTAPRLQLTVPHP